MIYARYVLASLFTICIALTSTGQDTGFVKGFIILNNGDTLGGWVKNKNHTPYRVLVKVKFKATEKGKAEDYSTDQLKGYQLGANKYISKDVDLFSKRDKWFVEVKVEGYLSYYELEVTGMGTGNISEYIILEKQNESDQLVYEKRSVSVNFKKRMSDFLADAPSLVEKIQNGSYKRNDLEAIVNEYNSFKKAR